jgi:hypothetical protein
MSWVNASNIRIGKYRRFCEAASARPHQLNLDMEIRWNSTYDMLKAVLPDKDNLTLYVNSNYGSILLTMEDWHAAQVLLDFMEILSSATNALSGVYYPTSPLMVHQLLLIAQHLKAHEDDDLLRPAVLKMQNKYLKYWKEIPLLYAFAFILDPRAKLDAFANVISLLTEAVGYDYTSYFSNVKIKLNEVYNNYNEKYAGVVRQQRPTSQPAPKNSRHAWSQIFSGSRGAASSSSRSSPASHSCGDGGELDTYLRSPKVSYEETSPEDFNILQWWNGYRKTYPVLSILARDVFTVPVSTTSSESAFSLAGRILEERRACLTPDMVSTLMCVKDNELAKLRAQHAPVNQELCEAFQSCYMDEVPED